MEGTFSREVLFQTLCVLSLLGMGHSIGKSENYFNYTGRILKSNIGALLTSNQILLANESGGYTCLKSYTDVSDAELSCKSETLASLQNQLSTFLHVTSHRGDPFNNLKLTLRETHLNMRDHYAKLIYSAGRNIFPLIVASDCDSPERCGIGGIFRLYLADGSMKQTSKVPDDFEMYKYLSHMALGVFSIVSPYFEAGFSQSWVPELRKYQSTLKSVISALYEAHLWLDPSDVQIAHDMVKIVEEYVEKSIMTQKVDEQSYAAFAKQLAPYIDQGMRRASRVQVNHIVPLLKEWKIELGEEWENVYAVVPTVWPVSQINVRMQMLAEVMDFEQMKEQVLVVDGVRSEEEAVTTLGRILTDRALALLVFGGLDDENSKKHAFSLSTRRDILSTFVAKGIADECQRVSTPSNSCPLSKNFKTMVS